jgi:hypothetical protein
MFEAPTVAGLAKKIEAAKRDTATRQAPELVAVSRERFRANPALFETRAVKTNRISWQGDGDI